MISPRSPHDICSGYVASARALDKFHAVLAGSADDVHLYNTLARLRYPLNGIDYTALTRFVDSSSTDCEDSAFIRENSQNREVVKMAKWNNNLHHKSIADIANEFQEFLEDHIEEFIPKHRPAYVWFDVYDLEKGRI